MLDKWFSSLSKRDKIIALGFRMKPNMSYIECVSALDVELIVSSDIETRNSVIDGVLISEYPSMEEITDDILGEAWQKYDNDYKKEIYTKKMFMCH